MSTKSSHLLVRLFAGLLVVAALIGGPGAARAFAADTVGKYVVTGSIGPDGSVNITATITFEGAAPASLIQKFNTTTEVIGDREYVYTIEDIKAISGGKDLTPGISQEGSLKVVTIPTLGLTAPVVLSYKVIGAAIREETGETTVSWRALQGLNLPVREFTADIEVPSMIASVDCKSGSPVSPGACGFWGGGTGDHPNPFFSDGPRGAGEVVNLIVRFPAGAVPANQNVRELWTLGRAFSAGPAQLATVLVLLALGGLGFWALHRRMGRDAAVEAEPTRVAEFRPVGDGESEFRVLDSVRPGHVGTLADERVDPIDVTSTLLDLAVRGHLLIEELPRDSAYGTPDWTFTRRTGGDELAAYEKTLLDAVAPLQGDPVKVSNLGGAVASVAARVQSELYDEVVARGWFARRPDEIRNTWTMIGWAALAVAVLATIVLVAFSTFGLVGLALIVVALLVIFLGQEMPARTAEGVSLLNGLGLLRAELLGRSTSEMPKGREIAELSELLPYAVVLGGQERWLKALVDADHDDTPDSTDLDWYQAPADWHLRDLPDSLQNFITTVQGTLFSR